MFNSKQGIDYVLKGKFPDFIKTHPVFKTLPKIKKVFPGIGLPNLSEPIEYSLATSFLNIKPVAVAFINGVIGYLDNVCYDLKYSSKLEASKILKSFISLCQSNIENIIVIENGKALLRLPVEEKSLNLSKGESFFKAYAKLVLLAAEKNSTLLPIEQIPGFAAFSSNNVPLNNIKIVFSSTEEVGAWDIAWHILLPDLGRRQFLRVSRKHCL